MIRTLCLLCAFCAIPQPAYPHQWGSGVMPTVREWFRNTERGIRPQPGGTGAPASSPSIPTPRQQAAQLHAQGLSAFKAGKLTEAIALLTVALNHAPADTSIQAALRQAVAAQADAERVERENQQRALMEGRIRDIAQQISRDQPRTQLPFPGGSIDPSAPGLGFGAGAATGEPRASSTLDYGHGASQNAPPVWLRSNSLIVDLHDLPPPTPPHQPLDHAAVERDLRSLRAQVRGFQEALRRYQKWDKLLASEREDLTNDANALSNDAIKRAFALSLELVPRYFREQLKSVNEELGKILDALIGATDAGWRERLHAVFKAAAKRKAEISRALTFSETAARVGTDVQRTTGVVDLARSKDSDFTRAMNGIKQIADITLNSSVVQSALKQSGLKVPDRPALILTLGESIMESTHDVIAESLAIVRLSQIDDQTRSNLLGVAKLSKHLQQTVDRIRKLEADIASDAKRR